MATLKNNNVNNISPNSHIIYIIIISDIYIYNFI